MLITIVISLVPLFRIVALERRRWDMVCLGDTFRVIVLAAGRGTRMNCSDQPKVLVPLAGKSLIRYVIESIRKSAISSKPVVIVGYEHEQVRMALDFDCEFCYQSVQLGTGHAVASARHVLEGRAGNIIVLYGDMPFISSGTIDRLASVHKESGAVLTMATVIVPDFEDWRRGHSSYGRVVRDSESRVVRIVEEKDAEPDVLSIREVNPSYFCFKAEWLWSCIDELSSKNSKGEYYLTDMAGIARMQGEEIVTVQIDPIEAVGINTLEQLEIATRLLDH